MIGFGVIARGLVCQGMSLGFILHHLGSLLKKQKVIRFALNRHSRFNRKGLRNSVVGKVLVLNEFSLGLILRITFGLTRITKSEA